MLDILFNIQKKRAYEELELMPLPEKVEYLFTYERIYELKRFYLISLGIEWMDGCYRDPNNLLSSIIPMLIDRYANAVNDAPTGLEHTNRNVRSEIDDLFLILDASLKSPKNMERTQKLVAEIGVKCRNFYLVPNCRFTQDTEGFIQDNDVTYPVKIEPDDIVEEYNLQGKPLMELPNDSPAYLSVKRILERAGYGTV